MNINKTILNKVKISTPTNIAIVGSRDFLDYSFFKIKVDYYLKNIKGEIIIVSNSLAFYIYIIYFFYIPDTFSI